LAGRRKSNKCPACGEKEIKQVPRLRGEGNQTSAPLAGRRKSSKCPACGEKKSNKCPVCGNKEVEQVPCSWGEVSRTGCPLAEKGKDSAACSWNHCVMSFRAAVDLAARDLAVVWHPCTQMHDHETLPMLPIARADGAWLTATDGRRYLDAVSSWWTCLLGHRHPRIVAALRDQLDRLDHVMLAGFTHEPAIELAEELVRIAPRRHSLSLLPAGETHSFSPVPASGAHAFSLLPASGEKVPEADEGPAPQAPDVVAADPRGARGPSSGAARHLLPVPRGEGKEYESVSRGEGKTVLTRVFYADNGSSAVEVALKLSFHYWKNLGR